jgi:uncharacterized protein involved in exopolysaccharide biosynthesis
MPEASRELTDQKRLEELEALYVNLRSQYTDAYPDVVKLRGEIADLKNKIASHPLKDDESKEYLDNPAFITLNSQLANITADINSINRQIAEYDQKEDEYRKRIETSLSVEEEYRALGVKRDNTQKKYNDLMQKLMEAKVSSGLEEEQKGERFTLLDPANYPEAPFKPNRKVIIILGFVAGFGLAVGAAAMREYLDHSIHDADTLAQATSFPVLGSIPEIITSADVSRRRLRRVVVFAVVVLVIAGGYFVCNYYFPYAVSQIIERMYSLMPENS